jgi:hypothetical protein
MNRAGNKPLQASPYITRCFKSCTRLGVSDRSDAKPTQPLTDRQRQRQSDCMCGTDPMAGRLAGWLAGWLA